MGRFRVGSGGIRLVPGRFRVAPGGSWWFRQALVDSGWVPRFTYTRCGVVKQPVYSRNLSVNKKTFPKEL